MITRAILIAKLKVNISLVDKVTQWLSTVVPKTLKTFRLRKENMTANMTSRLNVFLACTYFYNTHTFFGRIYGIGSGCQHQHPTLVTHNETNWRKFLHEIEPNVWHSPSVEWNRKREQLFESFMNYELLINIVSSV